MNKLYIVKSWHNMYVDNFKNGESELIHSYKLDAQIEAKSPLAAVQKYFADVLYFSFDIDKAGTEEAGCIHYSNLVDDDNSEANAKDIELWKEGKVKLYANNSIIEVSEIVKCNINE